MEYVRSGQPFSLAIVNAVAAWRDGNIQSSYMLVRVGVRSVSAIAFTLTALVSIIECAVRGIFALIMCLLCCCDRSVYGDLGARAALSTTWTSLCYAFQSVNFCGQQGRIDEVPLPPNQNNLPDGPPREERIEGPMEVEAFASRLVCEDVGIQNIIKEWVQLLTAWKIVALFDAATLDGWIASLKVGQNTISVDDATFNALVASLREGGVEPQFDKATLNKWIRLMREGGIKPQFDIITLNAWIATLGGERPGPEFIVSLNRWAKSVKERGGVPQLDANTLSAVTFWRQERLGCMGERLRLPESRRVELASNAALMRQQLDAGDWNALGVAPGPRAREAIERHIAQLEHAAR